VLHKERTDDEKKDIVADKQKAFLRWIQGCTDHIAKIKFLLANVKGNKKPIYLVTLDCKSVANEIMEQPLTKLIIQGCLKDAIMDS
jgi:hypothetical protein